MPITVAAQSKTRDAFARSNIGIVRSNPTRGIDISLRFSILLMSYVGSGLAMG
jgi:hypothetical protein